MKTQTIEGKITRFEMKCTGLVEVTGTREQIFKTKKGFSLSKPLRKIKRKEVITVSRDGETWKEYVFDKSNSSKACEKNVSVDTISLDRDEDGNFVINCKSYYIPKGEKEIACDIVITTRNNCIEQERYQGCYKLLKRVGVIK